MSTSLSWEYSVEIFFFSEKQKRKIFTYWLGFAEKMIYQSNNAGVLEYGQVATPTMAQVTTPTIVAQAPMVRISGHVYVTL